jgi:hypothetical protein
LLHHKPGRRSQIDDGALDRINRISRKPNPVKSC